MTAPEFETRSVICPGCGASSRVGDFCEKCGFPLTTHAATDPLLAIRTEGYAAHQAVTRPAKFLVVIGMWLWIGPVFLLSLGGLVFGPFLLARGALGFDLEEFMTGLVMIVVSLLFLSFSGPLVIRPTVNYLRARRQREATPPSRAPGGGGSAQAAGNQTTSDECRCLSCGKVLSAGESRCLECGWSYSERSE